MSTNETTEVNLPTTTTERLIDVADWIESGDKTWRQHIWVELEEPEALIELGIIEDCEIPRLADAEERRVFIEALLDELGSDEFALAVAGKRSVCGTYACAAGKAVMLTPFDEVEKILNEPAPELGDWPNMTWIWVASRALGIEPVLGDVIFMTYEASRVHLIAPILRRLAELPEDERTYERMIEEGYVKDDHLAEVGP